MNYDVRSTRVENETPIFALAVVRDAVRRANGLVGATVARRRDALVRARARVGANAVERARNSDARINSWKRYNTKEDSIELLVDDPLPIAAQVTIISAGCDAFRHTLTLNSLADYSGAINSDLIIV